MVYRIQRQGLWCLILTRFFQTMTGPLERDITFCSEFNFPSGDIILSVTAYSSPADQTSEPVYFRVHQHILRLHSEAFDKMLGVPLTTGESTYDTQVVPGLVDGIPVVPLQDDPRDIINLMRAIYFGL